LASQIDTSELNNKKLTVNTRLPDGLFPNIDPKNLINDGGAEQQVILIFSYSMKFFFFCSAILHELIIG
jgi:hypothetical protein